MHAIEARQQIWIRLFQADFKAIVTEAFDDHHRDQAKTEVVWKRRRQPKMIDEHHGKKVADVQDIASIQDEGNTDKTYFELQYVIVGIEFRAQPKLKTKS